MNVLLAFSIGCVVGSLVTQYWGALKSAWGRVSGAVFGRPPARAAVPKSAGAPEQNAEQNRVRVDFVRAFRNVIAFFVGLIGWCARNPILAAAALVLIVVVVWRPFAPVVNFVKCPFGGAGILWCSQSRAELQEALKDERDNTRVAQLEARVAALSAQLAENSANDRRRVDRIISQANEDIDNAVEAVDPEQLYRVYRDAYDGVWVDLSPAREPNSAPRGSDQVRRPDGSPI